MFACRLVFRPMACGLAALTSLLVLSACNGGGQGGQTIDPGPTATPTNGELTSKSTPKGVLQQDNYASCTAFKQDYAEALAEEFFSGYSYDHNCFSCDPATLVSVDFAEGDNNVTAAPGDMPQAAPEREVTQTNTQEVGVDEADLVETNPNDTEVYVLRRDAHELLVIDTADRNNLVVLSRTALDPDLQPQGMFFDVDNQRLAVILTPGYPVYYPQGAPAVSDAAQGGATTSGAPQSKLIAPPGYFEQGTTVQFYDVSNPSQPQLSNRFDSDGQYVNARRIEDRVHLITQYGFPYPEALNQDEEYKKLAFQDYQRAYQNKDEDEIQRLQPLIRKEINQAVQAMPIDELLPQLGTTSSGQNTLACDQIRRSNVSTRMGLLMINSIDTDGSGLNTLGSINNSWQIYASKQSLYLLQTSGGWWFDRQQKQQTAIYRFDISSGSALPGAVGVIDGWINNSYQLGEHQGFLRIASNEGRFNPEQPNARFTQASHLTVLDTASMDTVGQVRDFVPKSVDPTRQETIRSARFLGDRGYVVTFLQVDPLFTFDLSNPANPQVTGHVEIPGFSSYIYPLDQDHLLTIGRAAGPDDRGTGPAWQLRVFDVSDPTAPQSIAEHQPALPDNAYAYSMAESNPLAFTYLDTSSLNPLDERSGLLSIPAQISAPNASDALSGFVAYRIAVADDSASIEEYARIDHKDSSSGGDQCPPRPDDDLPAQGCGGFAPVVYNEPLRSVIFTEASLVPGMDTTTLLTLSSAKLKATDASGTQAQQLDTLELDE